MASVGGKTHSIVISGYYGFANSGDEAVLHAILTALRDQAEAAGISIEPIVLSVNPAQTMRVHQVRAVHRMRPREVLRALLGADALISGGGSLLQDVTSVKSIFYYMAIIRLALMLRKKVFIYAQGIGPIRRSGWFGPMIRSAFAACTAVCVRDQASRALLVSYGLPAERIDVVPDPVMGLGASLTERPPMEGEASTQRTPTIGVSVRYWRKDRLDLHAVAEGLAGVLRTTDAQLVMLPFHLPADREASQDVLRRLKSLGVPDHRCHIHPGSDHPKDMLARVATCDVLVGMRLHSLIYAATSGVVPIGICYDPKVEQFLQQIGETSVGTTDDLSSSKLKARVLDALQRGSAARTSDQRAAIQALQSAAKRPAQQLIHELRI
jgi:polysaccharide pyruvyl transferase CsaB